MTENRLQLTYAAALNAALLLLIAAAVLVALVGTLHTALAGFFVTALAGGAAIVQMTDLPFRRLHEEREELAGPAYRLNRRRAGLLYAGVAALIVITWPGGLPDGPYSVQTVIVAGAMGALIVNASIFAEAYRYTGRTKEEIRADLTKRLAKTTALAAIAWLAAAALALMTWL